MAEPRKNHGRKRVSRRSQAPREMTIQERLDLILRFDAGVLTTEKRHAIVEKITAALSAQMQDVADERYRHRKRGSIYVVTARGRLQVDGDLDNEKVVVYRGEDGQTWVRPEYEFNDGRFEPLAAAPAKQERGN